MIITTTEPGRGPIRHVVVARPRILPTTARVGDDFDVVAHARESWRYYMQGAKAAGHTNPARSLRCLEAAGIWRLILATRLVAARMTSKRRAAPDAQSVLAAAMWAEMLAKRQSGTSL